MTLEELNEYHELVKGLRLAEEMQHRIQAKGDILRIMPDQEGMSAVLDGSGTAFATEIADCEAQAEMYRAEIQQRRAEVERFIQDIKDLFIRVVFRLRFIEALTWKEVAVIVGGGNSEENVRATCYRYMRRYNKHKALSEGKKVL